MKKVLNGIEETLGLNEATDKNENPERGQAGATGFSTMHSHKAGRLCYINIDMNMMSIIG